MEYVIKETTNKELAIYAKPGFNWNQKEGFIKDDSNKELLLIKTFSQAQDDSMFCSLDIPGEEHENMKQLYYLMTGA